MQAHRLAEFFLLPGVPISRQGPHKGSRPAGEHAEGGPADDWGGYVGGVGLAQHAGQSDTMFRKPQACKEMVFAITFQSHCRGPQSIVTWLLPWGVLSCLGGLQTQDAVPSCKACK